MEYKLYDPDGLNNPRTGGSIYDFNDPASVAKMPDNDWQDLLFRNALTQQYDMSVTGGSENTKYAFSGAFVNQQGIMRGTDYTRYNFRSNISSQVFKFLEVGINLGAFYGSGNQRANGKDAPIQYALNLPPIYPVHNEDGTWGSMLRNPEIVMGDVPNPIAIAENQYDFQKRHGWMGTPFAELTLLEGLKYRINVNGNIFNRNRIRIRYQISTLDLDGNKTPRPAEAYDDHDEYTGWAIEQTLTWNKTF
jgi:hypothetical protein